MNKKNLFLLLIVIVCNAYAQEQEYFKTSEMKGFPSLLKQVFKYEAVRNEIHYFDIDEPTYNTIFYQNLVNENASNASFKRFYAILLKKLILKPNSFPGYEFVLNPKLEAGFYSKHRTAVSIREGSVTAEFQTAFVEIVFPARILLTKEKKRSSILASIGKGITFNNQGNLNRYSGLSINDIRDFTMPSSVLTGSFIALNKFDQSEFKFINDETYEFPYLIIDNNQLSNFISKYKQSNTHVNIKDVKSYKSAILLKNIQGSATFSKTMKCEVSEIYFFENCIAGVIAFPSNQKNKLLDELNSINTVVNRGKFKLKTNGDFPSIIDQYRNTYYKIEQDAKQITMYFVIVQ